MAKPNLYSMNFKMNRLLNLQKLLHRSFWLLLSALFFINVPVLGQTPKTISSQRMSTSGFQLDGKLDEEVWNTLMPISGFERNFPDDTGLAGFQTEVRMFFDDTYLYIGAKLMRDPSTKYAISTLQIDFPFYENDAFGVILDPFGDKTNGVGFYVNAGGAWRDEQVFAGAVVDATIDYKWSAEVYRTPEFWSLEMMIPFRSIRYSEGDSWNINFVRNEVGANERSSWVKTPINFLLGNLAFAGTLLWEEEPDKMKTPIFIIPSLSAMQVKEQGSENRIRVHPSLDSKIAISSAVNLDLTINPDFSQTRADELQLNLTRFELAFPEQRLFFLENGDLFSAFGNDSWGSPLVRPFFSRRIGLGYDSLFQTYVPTRVLGGARATGKLNPDLRFGAMSIFTAAQEKTTEEGRAFEPAQNYSVIAFQQKLLARSNIAAMIVNRQAFGNDSTNQFAFNPDDFNRLVALEFNFASKNDNISGKVFNHTEFKDRDQSTAYSSGVVVNHNTKHWRNTVGFSTISKNFNPEVGLVPRNDVLNANVHGAYSIFPKKGMVNQWEFIANPHLYFSPVTGKLLDVFSISGVHAILRKTEELWVVHIREKISLQDPFNPLFQGESLLDSGEVHTYDYLRIALSSDQRQAFYWQLLTDLGQYYSGNQYRISGKVNYRIRPVATIGLIYDLGHYSLINPEANSKIGLLGLTTDLTFRNNLFFSSMVQYASLSENVNLFARLQWRFKPLSDFFIIYSGNNDSVHFKSRNQNLVFKMVYWI